MTKHTWSVDVKGENKGHGYYSAFEISVVRDDNEHGFRSWGWCNGRNKLLVGSSNGFSNTGVHPFVFDSFMRTAHELADGLNKGLIKL